MLPRYISEGLKIARPFINIGYLMCDSVPWMAGGREQTGIRSSFSTSRTIIGYWHVPSQLRKWLCSFALS
jgi:hypothetical protein